ncbi:MAG: helix-turn-helix transcriptional regulator [Clostridia bacterium]|nr:helix-turn-helix transcriptional regulator [Clostridia bacterium]
METLDMIHSPNGEPLSFQEICAAEGYFAKHIHMHDTHEINLITTPSLCQVRCNGSLFRFQAPAVLLQSRGTYHAILSATGPFESHVIYFDPEHGKGAPSGKETSLFSADITAIHLEPAECKRLLSLFKLMKTAFPAEGQHLVMALLSRLCHLQKETAPTVGNTKNTYLFPLIRYVQDHLSEKLTIALLAGEFHVSPTKLKADFHALTGKPVKQFIHGARLRRARQLLSQDVPLSQIALACGFSGESHLIHAFRTAYGSTPGKWRRKGGS